MSIELYDVKEIYEGTGSLASYSFDFKIAIKDHLLVIILDEDGVEVERLRGTDTSFLSDVQFDAVDGGGTVILQDDLPAGYNIVILLANDEPIQNYEFKNKTSFTLIKFEQALDYIIGAVQRLAYRAKQSLRLHDLDDEETFNAQLPPGIATQNNRVFGVNSAGTGLQFGPTTIEISNAEGYSVEAKEAAEAAETAQAAAETAAAEAEGGLPAGTTEGEYIQHDGVTPVWESGTFSGFSLRYGIPWDTLGLRATLLQILNLGYLAPSISLSCSPSQAVREKGTSVAAVTMSATTTKNTDPITAVTHYRNSVLVDTEAAPVAGGAVETFVESTPFTDTMSFFSRVSDGTSTVQSNTVTYSYVYPYYSGAAVPGKTAAEVGTDLTKDIRVSTASLNKSFTAINGDVFYFAYPASYGALTSIKDENNFETFSDWTLTTANITGLDGNAISYRIYEFNNPVVAQTTNYTFVR